VILLDLQGQAHVIREAETLAYVQQLERVPGNLK
jgi:hypothetical protein